MVARDGGGNIGERVTAVEAGLVGITTQVAGLRGDIASLASSVSTAQRTNWPTLIAAAALLLTVFGAGLTPIYLMAGYAKDEAQAALRWQSDYMLGHVPTSSEPKLAEMKQMFVEVETQFRAFKERMIENESYTREKATENAGAIGEASEQVTKNRVAIAELQTRAAMLEAGYLRTLAK